METGVPPTVFGPTAFHLRVLVGEHDHGVPDVQLGVPDLAVWSRHPHPLGRAQHRYVEVDRGGAVADDEVRGDSRIALGNRIDHAFTSCDSGVGTSTAARPIIPR